MQRAISPRSRSGAPPAPPRWATARVGRAVQLADLALPPRTDRPSSSAIRSSRSTASCFASNAAVRDPRIHRQPRRRPRRAGPRPSAFASMMARRCSPQRSRAAPAATPGNEAARPSTRASSSAFAAASSSSMRSRSTRAWSCSAPTTCAHSRVRAPRASCARTAVSERNGATRRTAANRRRGFREGVGDFIRGGHDDSYDEDTIPRDVAGGSGGSVLAQVPGFEGVKGSPRTGLRRRAGAAGGGSANPSRRAWARGSPGITANPATMITSTTTIIAITRFWERGATSARPRRVRGRLGFAEHVRAKSDRHPPPSR